jgi:hypothetical protein
VIHENDGPLVKPHKLLRSQVMTDPTLAPRGTTSLPHLRTYFASKVLTINANPCPIMMMINTFPNLFSSPPRMVIMPPRRS